MIARPARGRVPWLVKSRLRVCPQSMARMGSKRRGQHQEITTPWCGLHLPTSQQTASKRTWKRNLSIVAVRHPGSPDDYDLMKTASARAAGSWGGCSKKHKQAAAVPLRSRDAAGSPAGANGSAKRRRAGKLRGDLLAACLTTAVPFVWPHMRALVRKPR